MTIDGQRTLWVRTSLIDSELWIGTVIEADGDEQVMLVLPWWRGQEVAGVMDDVLEYAEAIDEELETCESETATNSYVH